MKNTFASLSVVLAASCLSVGCSDSSDSPSGSVDGDYQAVITGVSFDFGSSEFSLANTSVADDPETTDVDESLDSYDIVNGYAQQDLSDIRTVTYGNHIYRLGRSSQDNVTKYSFDAPNTPIWQFSLNVGEETGANPHDMVFVSDEKAYVLRYGLGSILIVNPSVAQEQSDDFVIGEIDLSLYDSDGVPNVHRGVIHNGILYIVMQVLDESYAPREGYLVAIDTATDEEITIGSEVVKGLALNVRNPIDLDLHGNHLYISAIGRYGASWENPPRPPEYTGGIERINLNDYSSLLILDDGNATTHPYGQINGLAISSTEDAFFIGYDGWKDNTLYHIDLGSGAVTSLNNEDYEGIDIKSLAVDPSGDLWVGVGDDNSPRIDVMDASEFSLIETVYPDKNPAGIVFSSDLSEYSSSDSSE